MKTTQLLVLSALSLQFFTACNSKNDNFVSTLKQDRSEIRTDYRPEVTHDEIVNEHPKNIVSLIKVAPMRPTFSTDYIQYDTSKDKNINIFNGVDLSKEGASVVQINGKHIIIEKNHSQRLIEKLSNRLDVKKIVIAAETVEINSEFRIPGADIEIRAEHLMIGANGKIVTTPRQNKLIPKEFKNGSNGQRGGNLSLFINKIDLPSVKSPIFVLTGADGQEAGPGRDGLAGQSVPAISSDGLLYKTTFHRNCNRESGRPVCRPYETVQGINQWPTDGTDAIKGGTPGIGGKGGDLFSSVSIDSIYLTQMPGKIGALPKDTVGGAAGMPVRSYHIETGSTTSRITHKGKDASVIVKDIENGEKGIVVIDEKMKDWVTEGALAMMNEYAQDQYLANDFSNAKSSFLKISKLIIKSANNKKFSHEKLLATSSLNQLANHLDYYGNSATWSPYLSLESTVHTFVSNKKHLLKTLYLTYWLKNSKENVEKKYSALGTLAKYKYDSIENYQVELNSITKMLPNLRKSIQEFAIKEKKLKQKITQTELEIQRQAENELQPSGLLKVVRSIGAIATVIPAGQPALGLIGNGLATLSRAIESESPVSEILSSAPGIYESLNSKTFERSAKDWNIKWRELDFSELEKCETTREKLDYANNIIKFSTPIVNELNKQMNYLSQKEVPQNELDRKINEIKKSHPQFYSLIDLLKQTLLAKRKLVAQVKFFQQNWTKASTELSSELVEYIKVKRAQDALDQGGNLVVDNTISRVEKNTKRKLNLYTYYLTKAYEYRFLKTYSKPLSIELMNDKFRELVETDNGRYLSDREYESIMNRYDEILFDIKEKITNNVQNINVINDQRIYLELNQNELYHLNKSGSVEVSMFGDRVFPKDRENIRLNDISLSKVELSNGENIEITIERIGDHYIESNNLLYAYQSSSKNNKWIFKQDQASDSFYPLAVSDHSRTLLREIFGITSESVFMRPGAKAIYKVSLNSKSPDTVIDSLEIKLNCDMQILE